MRFIYLLVCVLFLLPLQGTAQEARVSKKEARMIERGLKRKEKKTQCSNKNEQCDPHFLR